MKNKKGGTLLNVLIIVGIIVLIGIFAILFYSQNNSSDIEISKNTLSSGQSIEVSKPQKVKFEVDNEEHTIKVNSINSDSVSLTIQSNPIQVNLKIGEEKKLDLDNDGFYDLYIKLNGIKNEKMDLFVKEINEKIGGNGGNNVNECIGAGKLVFDESTGETLGECCGGLVEIGDVFYDEEKTCEEIFMIVGYGSICSDCGNGICEDWENRCNCEEDCKESSKNSTQNNSSQNISTCANQGEQFSKVYTDEYPEVCCSGLNEWDSGFDTSIAIGNTCYDTMLASGNPVGTCIKKGDGICSSIENVCNSPNDCSNGQNSDYDSIGNFCNTAYDSYCEDNPFKDELEMCSLCSETPVPECANQGEWFDFSDPSTPNECCESLDDVHSTDSISVSDECYWTRTASGYPGGVCSDCGNGICEDVESVCGCAEDCTGKGNSDYNTIQEFCSEGYEQYCSDLPEGMELDLCDLC